MKKYIVFFIVIFSYSFLWGNDQELLDEAIGYYVKGELAETIDERRESFNLALKKYSEIESENSHLYYNIGNCYFQLEEYSWAILFYYKALTRDPRNNKILHNLQLAQKKLHLPLEQNSSIFKKVLFFHYYLSVNEKFKLFFILNSLIMAIVSINIWFPRVLLKRVIYFSSISIIVMLFSIFSSCFIEGVEAIIIDSTLIFKDSGKHYALVQQAPIPSGSKVEVLEVLKEGKWLKVLINNERFGYIPHQTAQVIN